MAVLIPCAREEARVANTVQIKCINRTERMSPHERITHVGGYVSSQWKITLNDAIGDIILCDERSGEEQGQQ